MSMPRHNIDQLLVLDAIVRTGSFAAAAESLNRVPSAVTYAVRNLEESLGIPLFEKVGRRSLLTADGHLLLEQARSVLAQARGLDRLADELAGEWETSIRLVADAALPITQIVRGLKRFFDRGLPTRVRLDIECQDGVLERFETEHADIMLTLDFDENQAHLRSFHCLYSRWSWSQARAMDSPISKRSREMTSRRSLNWWSKIQRSAFATSHVHPSSARIT